MPPSQIAATTPAAVTSQSSGAAGGPTSTTNWGAVNGTRIVSGSLSLPLYGTWVADVKLAGPAVLTNPATLTVGNLTLVGTVYRQAAFAGLTEARLIGGGGGWSKFVEPRAYNNPGGVPSTLVLTDAATEVGETVVQTSPTVLGPYWTRMGKDADGTVGRASDVLQAVVGDQWWVDTLGVTHAGPRTPSTVSSNFVVESFSGANGLLRIATEDPASWLPGATFSSATVAPQTIASVRHSLGADGVARMDVMVGGNDRWIEPLRDLIRSEVAKSLVWAKTWEYVVATATATTVDALPADSTSPVPPLSGVPMLFGLPGASSTPTPGTHVAIAFLDADPSRPRVVGVYDSTAAIKSEIDTVATLTLGDSSALPVIPAPWGSALTIDLAAFATSLIAFGPPAPPGPLTPLAAIGTALLNALGALPPGATVKVLAT